MRKAKFLGYVHKSGVFQEKPYSYYQGFFQVDNLPDSIGINVLTARLDELFPDLTKDNLNKECDIYDYYNNNRCQVCGVRFYK